MRNILFIVILATSFFYACKSEKEVVKEKSKEVPKVAKVDSLERESDDPIAFRQLTGGSICTVKQPDNWVIKDEHTYDSLWRVINANIDPIPDAPEVDFYAEMVLASFKGSCSSGGHSIAITGVSPMTTNCYVNVEYTRPGFGCMNTMMITSPWTMAAISRTAKQIVFRVKEVSKECK